MRGTWGLKVSRHTEIEELQEQVGTCRRCPRLVAWREEVASEKRAAFRDQEYWGRPVPSFGDPDARIVLLGLAPAAHGANRTGRMFTGDRSGSFLFASLHRVGLASQSESIAHDDGLTLSDCWITAAVRCAPPANKPTTRERDVCAHWLSQELELLARARVIVCLGGFAWDAALRLLAPDLRPKPRFGHGAEATIGDLILLGAYHPSQQNTFTGRLVPAQLDAIFERARDLVGR